MHKKILPKSILSGGPSKASLTPTFRDDKSTFESECDNWQRASFEKSTGPLLPKPQNQTRGLESLFLTSFLGHRENEAEFAYQRDESTEPSERASWASIIKGVLGNHFLVVCVLSSSKERFGSVQKWPLFMRPSPLKLLLLRNVLRRSSFIQRNPLYMTVAWY